MQEKIPFFVLFLLSIYICTTNKHLKIQQDKKKLSYLYACIYEQKKQQQINALEKIVEIECEVDDKICNKKKSNFHHLYCYSLIR